MKAATVAGGLGFTAMAGIMANAIGAPWWGLLIVIILGIVCTTVVSLAQIFLPQESSDKVLLYDKIMKHRDRRRAGVPTEINQRHQPRDTPAAPGRPAIGESRSTPSSTKRSAARSP